MKTTLSILVLTTALLLGAATADQPRVYITESQSLQIAAGAPPGAGTKNNLAIAGGTSPQNVEVMKTFARRCPSVVVTSNREKANYVVRLDHEAANPTTLFTRGNKVAVFDKDDDLMYSNSTRILSNAVKGACASISAASVSRSAK